MIELERVHDQAKELDRVLRCQSLPLGVRMMQPHDEIPQDLQRPVRDMGHHLSFCQALALSRRHGLTILESKEDMWCCEPVLGLGLAEPPDEFLDGHHRFPGTASTLEAGATWARNMPRLACDRYWGVLTGPLETAQFMPDIFIVYGEPAKMTQIMLAKNWLDGKDLHCILSGHAACVYYVVPPLTDREWHMTIPCGGDLRRAVCREQDMVFSAPIEALGDLLTGLKAIQKEGLGVPLHVSVAVEYPLPESYVNLGKMIGMDWVR